MYLVGAGPGDPDYLTAKALRLLQTADFIFHDDLISPEILALIPHATHLTSVGKRCGHTKTSQDQIHTLLINAAKGGRTVVRLKSGDPLIFGRCGEEMAALRQAGIDFEVVPGITAAFGAAAGARIPLTDRGVASKLVFLTNHSCAGKSAPDWKGVLSDDATVVIYMPGSDYERVTARLQAAGLSAETPCLLVSQAACPREQRHATTLADLPKSPRAKANAKFNCISSTKLRAAPGANFTQSLTHHRV